MDATFFWPEKRIANTTERLAAFGAIGGGEVTSLGRWAAERLLDKLAEPEAELTAAELIAYLADCDDDERDEDAWAWLNAQPDPAEAARQLLTAGASMEPRLRWIAADVVGLLQDEALPVWREMAAVPGMGPHAKFARFTIEAGPEPDEGEWLWLTVESAAAALADKGPDEAVTVLAEALSAEKLAADDLEHRLAVVRATGHPISAVARGSHRGLRRVRRSVLRHGDLSLDLHPAGRRERHRHRPHRPEVRPHRAPAPAPRQVLSREQILSHVWGYDYDPASNVVDVYIRYLRGKLGADRITTLRGAGYRLT